MSTSDYPRGGGLGWVIGGIWSVGSSRDSASAPDAGAGAVPAPGGHRRGIGRRLRLMAIWVVSLLVVAISLTFRRRILTDDPRPSLRDAGESFLLAIIHAHQLAAVFCNDEPHMRAMVSRSTDGDLLAPLLHLRRVTPVRGSTQRRGVDKGGRTALDGLAEGVLQGIPAVIAVDGPRGPRNTIHRGIALLAIETGAPIACAAGGSDPALVFLSGVGSLPDSEAVLSPRHQLRPADSPRRGRRRDSAGSCGGRDQRARESRRSARGTVLPRASGAQTAGWRSVRSRAAISRRVTGR